MKTIGKIAAIQTSPFYGLFTPNTVTALLNDYDPYWKIGAGYSQLFWRIVFWYPRLLSRGDWLVV
jgi:hypothetical protein